MAFSSDWLRDIAKPKNYIVNATRGQSVDLPLNFTFRHTNDSRTVSPPSLLGLAMDLVKTSELLEATPTECHSLGDYIVG